MITVDFRVTGYNGWSKGGKDIKNEIIIQLLPFSKRLENEIKASIKRNRPPKQSPVWAAAKGSKTTLFYTGFFRDNVVGRVRPGTGNLIALAEGGHFDNIAHPQGSGLVLPKLASVQLEGRSFKPTLAMRRAFWAKVGGQYKKEVVPKETWVIPPRDYLTPIMRNSRFVSLFHAAVKRAEKMVYGKGKK